jgi:hypothetical protein
MKPPSTSAEVSKIALEVLKYRERDGLPGFHE